MKKIIAVLLVTVGLLTLCACNSEGTGTNSFSKEKQQEIITAFIAENSDAKYPLKKDDISLRFYGEFDGAYVLFVDVVGWGYTAAIEREVVGGVEFVYSSGQKLTVYANGKFYSLSEAYDGGVLSLASLRSAQKNYKEGHAYLY